MHEAKVPCALIKKKKGRRGFTKGSRRSSCSMAAPALKEWEETWRDWGTGEHPSSSCLTPGWDSHLPQGDVAVQCERMLARLPVQKFFRTSRLWQQSTKLFEVLGHLSVAMQVPCPWSSSVLTQECLAWWPPGEEVLATTTGCGLVPAALEAWLGAQKVWLRDRAMQTCSLS
jgi:hypothetical protein